MSKKKGNHERHEKHEKGTTENTERHGKGKRGLVPELRFPEFRDSGEWGNEPFEKLYSFKGTNSLSRDKLNYQKGTIKNIHYGDIHTKFATLFDIEKELVPFINPDEPLCNIKDDAYCMEGDIIFADASEDLEGVGKSIELINLNNEKMLSGLHTLLTRQKTNKFIIGFGGYLFKSSMIRRQIQRESQGAKVLGISAGRLSNIKVLFPDKKPEQQKIADCLTSLDEFITAETGKLEAYKAHKKGLMQKLFPAEGKNVPEWRFPEFRGKGEWGNKLLGQLTTRIGDGIHGTPKYDEYGTFFFVNGNNLVDGSILISKSTKKVNKKEAIIHSRELGNRTILLSINGTIGNLALYNGELIMLGKSVAYLNIKEVIDMIFIYNSLQTSKTYNYFLKELTGSTIKNLSLKAIRETDILIPSLPEQQKIADCLSSLAELITAQAQKIDALKAHKKGLMQGLFPAGEEE